MQAYGSGFAKIYNQQWAGFAKQVAPYLLAFYAGTPGGVNQTLLDLCCGAGQLALYFLEQGYRVVGLDLSESMLDYARAKTRPYVEGGQARFVQGDAANFSLPESFGLVISTYDALNHLENLAALKSCFASVFAVLVEEGYFIFDLNTHLGLKRWNEISVRDDEAAMVVIRGFYDGQSERAWTKISGFVQTETGCYERFIFTNWPPRKSLSKNGWGRSPGGESH